MIIVVDIQPGHQDYIYFNLYEFCEWLNDSNKPILYLYNGPDFGFDEEYVIYEWLIEHGLNDDLYITFFQKNYAFFRDLMDSFAPDDDIIEIIKYLIEGNIRDIREISDEGREYLILDKGIDSEYFNGDYNCYLPELYDFLKPRLKPNNIIVGGGVDQCLKEVQLLLNAMGVDYTEENEYIY